MLPLPKAGTCLCKMVATAKRIVVCLFFKVNARHLMQELHDVHVVSRTTSM